MASPMPKHPQLRGNFAPLRMECDAPDLIVHGEIPKELHGSYYRNGPDPQYAPRGDHHWFAGDGMIHGFHFEDGRCSYLNRWVRTKKWELEHDAGEALFDPFNPMNTDPSVAGVDSTLANTNIVWHGGKLLALEEGHAPFELDPKTLASLGEWTFGGADSLQDPGGDDQEEVGLILANTTPGTHVIPTPGTAALLGFAGLAASRRRRA